MKMNKIDSSIIRRDGPFKEFKQDASIVSVRLKSGKVFKQVLLLYPDNIIGMKGYRSLPFEVNEVMEVFQDTVDLASRSERDWLF